MLKLFKKEATMGKQHPTFHSPAWANAISKQLKEAKSLHALSYKNLSERLEAMGIEQTPENLSSKFNRGIISAQLFCACLIAMGETTLDLSAVIEPPIEK